MKLKMNDIRMKPKLIGLFLLTGLIPLLIAMAISYQNTSKELRTQSFNQLESVRDIKQSQLDRFFSERQGDVGVLAETVDVLREEAFQKLESVQELKRNQIEDYFEERYADIEVYRNNSAVETAFERFSEAFHEEGIEGKAWKEWDEYHGPKLKTYVEKYGYYDLFMISSSGDVVWTAAQEDDLATNLETGPYADSGLAEAFKQGKEKVVLQDYEYYEPSKEEAAFIAGPVHNSTGELLGVLAYQLSSDKTNNIVQQRQGMGQTGETYLVGRDQGVSEFRSDMLTMGDGEYVIGYEISTPYIDKALNGDEGQEVYTDSSGRLVIVAYDPLAIEGLNWAMVSKIDMEEAIAPKVKGKDQDYFTDYKERYGYYDLFLIHPEGMVFYTVEQEADYQTNILNGTYKDSNLGDLTRQILQNKSYGIVDFAPYAPSDGAPAAFIGQPIIHNGEVEVIVALQLSLEAINNIMQDRNGMGQTGETYLVGSDLLMRSDSYLDPENHSVVASFSNPSKGKVDTEAARSAFSGVKDEKIITDYNGNPVLSAFAPMQIGDFEWAILAEIDQAEAFSNLGFYDDYAEQLGMLGWAMLILVFISVCVIVFALFLANSIANPLIRGVEFAEIIGNGDFTHHIQENRQDEIGILVRSLNQMRERLNDVMSRIGQASEQVASSSEELSASSQNLANAASEQAASLEETSASIEELTSSIEQSANNANETEGVSSRAAVDADNGGQAVVKTVDAMKQIAEQITIINDIAEQTNLLALNAAIEAARAGEMGKGFAVVAVEVRKLAERSQTAAKEISEVAENSVHQAEEAGNLIQEIVPGIKNASQLVQQINLNCNEQSENAEQISKSLQQLDEVTQQNSSTSEECASASEELSAQAVSLQELISQFKLEKQKNSGSDNYASTKKSIQAKKSLPEPDDEFEEFKG